MKNYKIKYNELFDITEFNPPMVYNHISSEHVTLVYIFMKENDVRVIFVEKIEKDNNEKEYKINFNHDVVVEYDKYFNKEDAMNMIEDFGDAILTNIYFAHQDRTNNSIEFYYLFKDKDSDYTNKLPLSMKINTEVYVNGDKIMYDYIYNYIIKDNAVLLILDSKNIDNKLYKKEAITKELIISLIKPRKGLFEITDGNNSLFFETYWSHDTYQCILHIFSKKIDVEYEYSEDELNSLDYYDNILNFIKDRISNYQCNFDYDSPTIYEYFMDGKGEIHKFTFRHQDFKNISFYKLNTWITIPINNNYIINTHLNKINNFYKLNRHDNYIIKINKKYLASEDLCKSYKSSKTIILLSVNDEEIYLDHINKKIYLYEEDRMKYNNNSIYNFIRYLLREYYILNDYFIESITLFKVDNNKIIMKNIPLL